jgi:hypothetical protein
MSTGQTVVKWNNHPINETPSEIQYCVGKGPLRNGRTVDKARAEISRWRTIVEKKKQTSARNREILSLALRFAQVIAGLFLILLLALNIRFRAKIAAGLYNVFVGCLALRLRFDRSRKRFLDNAIKEAENRLGWSSRLGSKNEETPVGETGVS